MQNRKTKGSFKSRVLSVVKYVFAMAMFGMIVLMVIATYVAAN